MIEINEMKVEALSDNNPEDLMGGVICGWGTCGGYICGEGCYISSGSLCGVWCK